MSIEDAEKQREKKPSLAAVRLERIRELESELQEWQHKYFDYVSNQRENISRLNELKKLINFKLSSEEIKKVCEELGIDLS